MEKTGIIDIGSNTVVLITYDSIDPIHVQEYCSEPVRLVSYNHNGFMSKEGIEKTLEVLDNYRKILEQQNVTRVGAFITEPWRNLKNTDELMDGLARSGFSIEPLSGRKEAELDFYGSRMDCSDIETGNAFDVGGGSSELISFIDGKIHEALSIPVGAVRLKELPIDPTIPEQYMNDAFLQAPKLLDTPSSIIVGIGGTARATGLLGNALFPGEMLSAAHVETMLKNLIAEEPDTIAAMKRVITPGRWPVLAPGMNMLLGIMKAYQAETLRVSEGCVREGYLLTHFR